eukprot:gene14035-biopygen11702
MDGKPVATAAPQPSTPAVAPGFRYICGTTGGFKGNQESVGNLWLQQLPNCRCGDNGGRVPHLSTPAVATGFRCIREITTTGFRYIVPMREQASQMYQKPLPTAGVERCEKPMREQASEMYQKPLPTAGVGRCGVLWETYVRASIVDVSKTITHSRCGEVWGTYAQASFRGVAKTIAYS